MLTIADKHLICVMTLKLLLSCQNQKNVMIFRTQPSMGVRGQVLVAGWDKLTYLGLSKGHTDHTHPGGEWIDETT